MMFSESKDYSNPNTDSLEIKIMVVGLATYNFQSHIANGISFACLFAPLRLIAST